MVADVSDVGQLPGAVTVKRVFDWLRKQPFILYAALDNLGSAPPFVAASTDDR